MADNRGLPSATSQKSIDGIHRTRNNNDKLNNSTLSVLKQIYGNTKLLNDISNELNKNFELSEKKSNSKNSNENKKTTTKSKNDLKNKIKNKKSTSDKDRENIKSMLKSNNSFIKSSTDKFAKIIKTNEKSLMGVAGPLNLLISPLNNFVGGFDSFFKGITNPFKKMFGKFTKKNPNANDVLKSGAFGVGSLYIGNILTKIFGKGDSKKNKSKFDKMKGMFGKGGMMSATALMGKGKLGGILTKILPKAGLVMIAIAIIKMAIDGINGMLKSKEWGTSKMSGFLGGFLGGTSEGIIGAFKNMGKWALMGAGIGALIPPFIPTAIAGGLIGAVIGGILGAIGGKNLAKGFDKIGSWFKDVFWEGVKDFAKFIWDGIKNIGIALKNIIFDVFNVDKFISIFKSDESIGKKIGKALGLLIVTMVTAPFKLMSKMKSGMTKLIINGLGKSKVFVNALGDFGGKLINGMGRALDKGKILLSNAWDKTKEGVSKAWDSIKIFGGDVWEGLKESELGDFVKNIFTSLNEGITKFFKENPVGKWMSSIMTSIQKALGTIGDFFGFISDNWDWKHPIESMSNIFGGFKVDKDTGLSKFDIWQSAKYESVDDAIIRTDGNIIKTNPQDTLVALKNVPLSMEQVRSDTTKNLNSSLSNLGNDKTLEKKLTTIIDVLSKILDKDVQVNLPPQTRGDLDIIMSGGMI